MLQLRRILRNVARSYAAVLCLATLILVLCSPGRKAQDRPESSSSAQNITEYGKPEELKGVTKIFLFAGADMYSRDRIIKEIEKRQKKGGAIANLKIVDRANDAEVLLTFSEKGESYASQVIVTSNPGSPTSSGPIIYGYSRTGVGLVLKPLPNEKGMRLLMNFTGEKWRRGQDGPATKFGRAFVAAYLKANAEDKK